MKSFIAWGLRISILTFLILHLFTAFFPVPILLHILSISGILIFLFTLETIPLRNFTLNLFIFFSFLIFLFTLGTIPLRNFKLPLFILFSSIIILILSNTHFFVGLLQGVLQMRNVIGLLIVIPLISWVLQEEPYIEDIISLFHKLINSSRKFYFTLMSLTQVLTYFLLFGSITMMYQ